MKKKCAREGGGAKKSKKLCTWFIGLWMFPYPIINIQLEILSFFFHRNVLENQLGISWNRVKEIVRRTPKDDNGNIDYKDFLETVKRYRLNTEQGTALKSIVRSFAYAEEFTCVPFKW